MSHFPVREIACTPVTTLHRISQRISFQFLGEDMKRRHLLQAMLTVPVASAIGGCRHEHRDHPRPLPARGGTLRVMLQGPFALVLDTTNKNKITAYVPFTD